jgi:glucose/arabinose dehydrogenase
MLRFMKKIIGFILSLIIFLLLSPAYAGTVHAAPPKDFQTTQIIGTGLSGPSGFEFAPDGRVFIIQRTGEIKIYKNGQLLSQNFAVLQSIASGDRGLIGIAFDPQFTTNHYVYFYYTGLDKLNRLVRFDATTDVGTNSYVLYQTAFPSEQLHVGGTIRFGPDGKLYFAVGDNGYSPNAQDLSNPHGKILRINKDGSIPTDNPFYGVPGALPEIWAYGMRNPWRFQFDSTTGRLYVGDVGADSWEELNLVVKGGNYGWPNCEGLCVPTNSRYIDPLYTYPHELNGQFQSSAVTMGPVYHANMFPPAYENRLFYGDYARGIIRTVTLDANGNSAGTTDFDMQAGSVVDLKVASDGSMYYITYYPGAMYRITYNTANHIPVANASADNLKGASSPFTVNFSSNGTYDPDNDKLSYEWNFGDGTLSPLPNPSKTYTRDGAYTVQLTVSDGVNTAQARPLVIQIGCAPKVTIGSPKDNSNYKSGDSITVNASAIDCAGFDINDAALSTTVKLHHTTHIHPFLDNLRGRSNTFTIPTDGEPSPDTWFEIDVTATDTNGLATTAVTNIYPIKSTMTFATVPTGLQILIDGIPANTTQAIQGVVGFKRELNVSSSPQQIGGKYYVFDHWSDNGAQRHVIATPATDTTYTAYFKETSAPQDPALTYTIYDELLGYDWQDKSISSSNDFTSTVSYTGSNAISWVANKAQAKFLLYRYDIPLEMKGFSALTVALRASQAGQKVSIQLYNDADQPIGNNVDVANYGGALVAGAYKVYTIPLSAFGVSSTATIRDIHLQNMNTSAQPPIYIDRFGFTSNTLTPTPTQSVPTPTAQQPTPTATPTTTNSGNLVKNNSFETTGSNWLTPWVFAKNGGAGTIAQDTIVPSDGNASAKIDVTTASSANPWYLQLLQTGVAVEANQTYTVSFSAKASKTRTIEAVLQQYGSPYTLYWYQSVPLTTTLQTFTYTVTPTNSDPNSFIGFNAAGTTGQVWIDNVKVCKGTCGVVTVTPTPVISTPTPTSTPTIPTPTPIPSSNTFIYDDGLSTGWQNWSWDSSVNFSDTTKPYKGTNNILWKPTGAWAGLLLHTDNGINTTGYTAFSFAIQATKAGQQIGVQLYDANDAPLGSGVNIAAYGGDPVVGSYKDYTIPLSALASANKTIKDFHIQDISGQTTNTIYVDAIAFVGSTNPTPTVTPTAMPTATPAATPTPSVNRLVVYGDALASGWQSWSWDAIIDFALSTPFYTGTKAISYQATAAWSGMDLHNPAGVNTTGYTTLHLALRASQAGQKYAVFIEGANEQPLSNALPLASVGGDPVTSVWKVYEIPLANLNASNAIIKGIVIHEITGGAQPAVYVDEVELR